MSSSDRSPGDTATVAALSTTKPAADPYTGWTERVQRPRGRHSAITRNLQSWASYKTWADRARTDWEDGSGES